MDFHTMVTDAMAGQLKAYILANSSKIQWDQVRMSAFSVNRNVGRRRRMAAQEDAQRDEAQPTSSGAVQQSQQNGAQDFRDGALDTGRAPATALGAVQRSPSSKAVEQSQKEEARNSGRIPAAPPGPFQRDEAQLSSSRAGHSNQQDEAQSSGIQRTPTTNADLADAPPTDNGSDESNPADQPPESPYHTIVTEEQAEKLKALVLFDRKRIRNLLRNQRIGQSASSIEPRRGREEAAPEAQPSNSGAVQASQEDEALGSGRTPAAPLEPSQRDGAQSSSSRAGPSSQQDEAQDSRIQSPNADIADARPADNGSNESDPAQNAEQQPPEKLMMRIGQNRLGNISKNRRGRPRKRALPEAVQRDEAQPSSSGAGHSAQDFRDEAQDSRRTATTAPGAFQQDEAQPSSSRAVQQNQKEIDSGKAPTAALEAVQRSPSSKAVQQSQQDEAQDSGRTPTAFPVAVQQDEAQDFRIQRTPTPSADMPDAPPADSESNESDQAKNVEQQPGGSTYHTIVTEEQAEKLKASMLANSSRIQWDLVRESAFSVNRNRGRGRRMAAPEDAQRDEAQPSSSEAVQTSQQDGAQDSGITSAAFLEVAQQDEAQSSSSGAGHSSQHDEDSGSQRTPTPSADMADAPPAADQQPAQAAGSAYHTIGTEEQAEKLKALTVIGRNREMSRNQRVGRPRKSASSVDAGRGRREASPEAVQRDEAQSSSSGAGNSSQRDEAQESERTPTAAPEAVQQDEAQPSSSGAGNSSQQNGAQDSGIAPTVALEAVQRDVALGLGDEVQDSGDEVQESDDEAQDFGDEAQGSGRAPTAAPLEAVQQDEALGLGEEDQDSEDEADDSEVQILDSGDEVQILDSGNEVQILDSDDEAEDSRRAPTAALEAVQRDEALGLGDEPQNFDDEAQDFGDDAQGLGDEAHIQGSGDEAQDYDYEDQDSDDEAQDPGRAPTAVLEAVERDEAQDSDDEDQDFDDEDQDFDDEDQDSGRDGRAPTAALEAVQLDEAQNSDNEAQDSDAEAQDYDYEDQDSDDEAQDPGRAPTAALEDVQLDEAHDEQEPGPSTRPNLRKRPSDVEYFEAKRKRTCKRPPIRLASPNRVVSSKKINGHQLFINQAMEVVVDDEDLLSEDDDFEEAEKNYAPMEYTEPEEFPEPKFPTSFSKLLRISRAAQELSDGHALRDPEDPERSWMESMRDEASKLDGILTVLTKIRNFSFSKEELDVVWNTAPMSRAGRAMLPTHNYISNVYMARELIKIQIRDEEDGMRTAPDDPMEWLEELKGTGVDIKSSLSTPTDYHSEADSVSLVDIVERNKHTEHLEQYLHGFPRTVPELRKMFDDHFLLHKFYRMLQPRRFLTGPLLKDLLKMVWEEYLPSGGMYRKLLLNIAFHFQYRLKPTQELPDGWEMVVFKEQRLFEGIQFNQFGELINAKLPFNIHNHLAERKERAAKRQTDKQLLPSTST